MMRSTRYEQLQQKQDEHDEHIPTTAVTENSCTKSYIIRIVCGLLLILLYFALSIGLTFYQQWLLQGLKFPLSVVIVHLVVKFCLSAVIRGVLYLWTGIPRVTLPFLVSFKSVAPTGLASGIDVGFSNWALELVTVSLYTMTKSTAIIFILFFAILLGLEKKSWSLVMIVVMISSGLTMFTYKATQFNVLGFSLLLVASLSSGLRWTFAQMLMQKSKLGLNNPLDLVYYVQPWMLVSVLPLAIFFEGFKLVESVEQTPSHEMLPYVLEVLFGACIAFSMELSEYLVVTYTSSLTLSIAGIFKEMCILVLAVVVAGDQLSPINAMGLFMCFFGIMGHIIHKFLTSSTNNHHKVTSINYPSRITDNNYLVTETLDVSSSMDDRDSSYFRRNSKNRFNSIQLLPKDRDNTLLLGKSSDDNQSCDSDDEENVILDVLHRRDMR